MQITGKDLLVGVTLEDLESLATENTSLRGYLQGYIAEMFLKRKLERIPGVSEVSKIPDQNEKKGDFQFMYLGKEWTLEVKSILTKSVREDILNGGWNGRVKVTASDSQTTADDRFTYAMQRGQFDILAISAFAIGKGWDFYFIAEKYLPESGAFPGRLQTGFTINTANTPCLHTDLTEVLEDLTG